MPKIHVPTKKQKNQSGRNFSLLAIMLGLSGCGVTGDIDSAEIEQDQQGDVINESINFNAFVNQSGGDTSVELSTSANAVDLARRSIVGPCTVAEEDGSVESPANPISIGTVKITGGTQPIQLEPNTNNEYDTFSVDESLWKAGNVLTIAATGASGSRPFTKRIRIPEQVTLLQPTFAPGGQELMIDRQANLPVSWSGGKGGVTMVSIFSFRPDGTSTVVSCAVPSFFGASFVPNSALSRLPSGPPVAGEFRAIGVFVTPELLNNPFGPFGIVPGTKPKSRSFAFFAPGLQIFSAANWN
jgi:hypothetical protein